MLRPTVLVDMDGPLADFDKLFFERCADNGWDMDVAGPEQQTHRFATGHIVNPEHAKLARKMVNTPGWFRDLPPQVGAYDGLYALGVKADVWICTKPLEANPSCRDDKAWWLIRHFGQHWEQRLIITPDKSMVRGTILLDDAPKLDWLPKAWWSPVIFTRPWNREGSEWDYLNAWTWGQPLDELL